MFGVQKLYLMSCDITVLLHNFLHSHGYN